MPASGIARVRYSSKSHTVARLRYDKELQLAVLTVSGDLEVELNLRSDQLEQLLSDGARVLDRMLEDPGAIGNETLAERQRRAIDRLEHLLPRDES